MPRAFVLKIRQSATLATAILATRIWIIKNISAKTKKQNRQEKFAKIQQQDKPETKYVGPQNKCSSSGNHRIGTLQLREGKNDGHKEQRPR